jgi:hypothetical protein
LPEKPEFFPVKMQKKPRPRGKFLLKFPASCAKVGIPGMVRNCAVFLPEFRRARFSASAGMLFR